LTDGSTSVAPFLYPAVAGFQPQTGGRFGEVPVHLEPYPYREMSVSNVVAELSFSSTPSHHDLVGAHYDSVIGTVGADDNASAGAVLLETARELRAVAAEQSHKAI
jgi:Zn-dependent M28 family amino/carboxypeptidase